MKTHTAKIVACHICDAKFKQNRYLTQHMNLHKGKKVNDCPNFCMFEKSQDKVKSLLKENNQFQCSICKKFCSNNFH